MPCRYDDMEDCNGLSRENDRLRNELTNVRNEYDAIIRNMKPKSNKKPDKKNCDANIITDLLSGDRHNSDTAIMLCHVLKWAIEREESLDGLWTPELTKWWKEHKFRDQIKSFVEGNEDG